VVVSSYGQERLWLKPYDWTYLRGETLRALWFSRFGLSRFPAAIASASVSVCFRQKRSWRRNWRDRSVAVAIWKRGTRFCRFFWFAFQASSCREDLVWLVFRSDAAYLLVQQNPADLSHPWRFYFTCLPFFGSILILYFLYWQLSCRRRFPLSPWISPQTLTL
jgi:hypothetical protein